MPNESWILGGVKIGRHSEINRMDKKTESPLSAKNVQLQVVTFISKRAASTK